MEAVEVVGNTMYIGVDTATGNLGDAGDDFQIIDITNPDRPRYIGGLSSGILRIYDIEIAGQYAYLIGQRDETFGSAPNLYVVDISDPNNPSIVYSEVYANTLNYYWGNTLKISGNYLYVGGFHMTSAWHEIRVYDISDPTALSFVSGISLNTRVNSLDVLGNN